MIRVRDRIRIKASTSPNVIPDPNLALGAGLDPTPNLNPG